jgi:hypothetical protein
MNFRSKGEIMNRGLQIDTMPLRFCPVCNNSVFFQDNKVAGLSLMCRHCGFNQPMNPANSEEALILETTFGTAKDTSAVAQLNEYTKLDPTLPHLKTIPCPNAACPSTPETRKILYKKTDVKNLKFEYSCTTCQAAWSS